VAGDHIQVAVGDSFEVSLPGNPTTGYDWSLPDPPPGIELVDEGFDVTSSVVGGGGEHRFTLRATQPGRSVLHFAYRRSWAPDEALEHHDVEVEASG
jgi:inhibitor of cysteine peptidase